MRLLVGPLEVGCAQLVTIVLRAPPFLTRVPREPSTTWCSSQAAECVPRLTSVQGPCRTTGLGRTIVLQDTIARTAHRCQRSTRVRRARTVTERFCAASANVWLLPVVTTRMVPGTRSPQACVLQATTVRWVRRRTRLCVNRHTAARVVRALQVRNVRRVRRCRWRVGRVTTAATAAVW